MTSRDNFLWIVANFAKSAQLIRASRARVPRRVRRLRWSKGRREARAPAENARHAVGGPPRAGPDPWPARALDLEIDARLALDHVDQLETRRWLPRQINIAKVSDEEIQDIVITADLTPRKCLGSKTPFQAILKELGKNCKSGFHGPVAPLQNLARRTRANCV